MADDIRAMPMQMQTILDGGRVAEEGTFDELMAKGGFFATLAKRQM